LISFISVKEKSTNIVMIPEFSENYKTVKFCSVTNLF